MSYQNTKLLLPKYLDSFVIVILTPALALPVVPPPARRDMEETRPIARKEPFSIARIVQREMAMIRQRVRVECIQDRRRLVTGCASVSPHRCCTHFREEGILSYLHH